MTIFRIAAVSALAACLAYPAIAQDSSSSSSSSQGGQTSSSTPSPRRGVDAAGSAITLETSEALFTIAAGLNACGYNADLERSNPVRAQIRADLDEAVAAAPEARDAKARLCEYVVQHQLSGALNLSQYVSLALFTTQPPELTISVAETDMPPDSLQVVNVLPLLRTFAEATHLHTIWLKHRPQYEAIVAQVHDPLTRVLLDTNIYLRQPVSSYDGRKFLILLEPLLSPAATNARIYGADYFVVTSPSSAPDLSQSSGVRLDDLRHTYLHYQVEPLIYSRASAMERLQPLLNTVRDAPLEFQYKNDIVSLISECLIKAIEARTMDVGFQRPVRPVNVKQRSEIEHYNMDLIDYERRAEIVRRKQVDSEMRQGWVLTEYLYAKLAQMESNGVSLKEDIGEMVYGMDVQHEASRVKNLVFDAHSKADLLAASTRRPRPREAAPTGLDLGEMKLLKGDVAGAETIGSEALSKNPNDARALYLLGRVDIMHRNPEAAESKLKKAVDVSKDAETTAWAHIYLGRLYDTIADGQARSDALEQYKAAFDLPGIKPATKAAAAAGIQKPFTRQQAPSLARPEGQSGLPVQ